MNAHEQLVTLEHAVQAWREGHLSIADLSRRCRGLTALLSALPPPFETVLHQLLDRLESAALFTEESCSFSQNDLMGHLDGWATKARQRLG